MQQGGLATSQPVLTTPLPPPLTYLRRVTAQVLLLLTLWRTSNGSFEQLVLDFQP